MRVLTSLVALLCTVQVYAKGPAVNFEGQLKSAFETYVFETEVEGKSALEANKNFTSTLKELKEKGLSGEALNDFIQTELIQDNPVLAKEWSELTEMISDEKMTETQRISLAKEFLERSKSTGAYYQGSSEAVEVLGIIAGIIALIIFLDVFEEAADAVHDEYHCDGFFC